MRGARSDEKLFVWNDERPGLETGEPEREPPVETGPGCPAQRPASFADEGDGLNPGLLSERIQAAERQSGRAAEGPSQKRASRRRLVHQFHRAGNRNSSQDIHRPPAFDVENPTIMTPDHGKFRTVSGGSLSRPCGMPAGHEQHGAGIGRTDRILDVRSRFGNRRARRFRKRTSGRRARRRGHGRRKGRRGA